MSILSKLPIIGRGSYEPNFAVVVEGLDEIVTTAVSCEQGREYILGKVSLEQGQAPLSEIRVVLKPSRKDVTNPAIDPVTKKLIRKIIGYVPSYTLEAAIDGTGSKPELPVDSAVVEKAGFRVSGGKEGTFLHIRGLNFRTDTPAEYSGNSQNGTLKYASDTAGLTTEDVGKTIKSFAQLLECVVNSIYKAASRTPPEQTLELKLGEQVRRIRGRKIEVASKQPASGNSGDNGEFDEETYALNLEAVRSEVTFKNIGGYQSVKEQLSDFLLAIKNPSEARRHGYTPSKGWLLHGPPGTGKTLFGRALAGEAGAEFVYFNASDALQMYVGQSTKALKDAFEGAQKRADETKKPVILFIDEIDSIFPKRGTAHDVKVDLVNLFNQYMDGFETKKVPNVYVVAATNRLHEMDESATRAGRFVKIEVPLPDLEARTAIFQVTHKALEKEAGTQLFDPGIDYRPLSERTEKFSGADIAAVMRGARQKAFRQAAVEDKKNVITTSAADLETQISAYRSQKQDGSGKRPLGEAFRPRGG